ncbi:MAG TPA: ribosome small subunit-dependent GTPase A [Candidatus Wallbacteria bacterium]|nr:ribosome small subunit-dependent GTPase A [Candidatus Wallbacteria bacterium]
MNSIGWNAFFEAHFAPYKEKGYEVARVAVEHKHKYTLYAACGEITSEVSGKLRFEAKSREDFPATGDFVVIDPRPGEERAIIHAVLPRKTKFSRKSPGELEKSMEEKIVATNMDFIFIMSSLNNELSLRRIERYLVLAYESGAKPVIVLTKSDLAENPAATKEDIERIALGVDVCVTSAVTGEGVEDLKKYFAEGVTIAFLGSSGVGKSSIINILAGCDLQKVSEISEYDDRGKHTTTRRELIILPSRALVMDTPGMRELQMWEAGSGFSETFADIEELAKKCKFGDCAHNEEPGCAVLKALDEGTLDAGHLKNYRKLNREIAHFNSRNDALARSAEQKKWKQIAKLGREISKNKLRG